MSSFLIHLLLPVLVVLSTRLFRLRDAWIWSWPAWAGDIDYLGWVFHVKYGLPNVHRALFHNVWWLLLALGFSVTAWRRWHERTGAPFSEFLNAKPAWILAPFMYATHLVLDLFAGGILPFWPISLRTFFWDFQIDVDTSRPIPQPIIEAQAGSFPGAPDVSEIYTWMTAEQFAFFLLYLLSLGLLLVYERRAPGTSSLASRVQKHQRP